MGIKKKRTKRSTRKQTLINKILAIIKEHGKFGISDVEDETICISTMGDLTAEADFFCKEDVQVKIYRPSGVSSDAITSYYVEYEELEKDVLEEILRVAENYAVECDKTFKRTLN